MNQQASRPASARRHDAFVVALAIGTFLMASGNTSFFKHLGDAMAPDSLLAVVSVGVVLWVALCTVLCAAAWPYLFKPVACILIMVTAVAALFMDTYGVLIDESMLRNAWETDSSEARELITIGSCLRVGLLGALPALLVARLRLRQGLRVRELGRRALALAVLWVVAALLGWLAYQDVALVARAHPDLQMRANPLSPLAAVWEFVRKELRDTDASVAPVGLDAHRPVSVASPRRRRRVVVFVVGETARADHFSLNGYARQTNPELAARDVLSLRDVTACGTSTAESLPCMFSMDAREDYSRDRAKVSENVLDVIQRAGVGVLWRENNSGGKGVCDRVPFERVKPSLGSSLRDGREVYDAALLEDLPALLMSGDDDLLVVLHQKGSHGPAYSSRVPPAFRHFQPAFEGSDFASAELANIVNAYDNTILYTDFILAGTIDALAALGPEVESCMIYASDHGESLGEAGLFLHGLPFWMAPDAQTHIPLILWLSPPMQDSLASDTGCLASLLDAPWSHDNLSHTLLGLFGVVTEVYDPSLDLLAPCAKR